MTKPLRKLENVRLKVEKGGKFGFSAKECPTADKLRLGNGEGTRRRDATGRP